MSESIPGVIQILLIEDNPASIEAITTMMAVQKDPEFVIQCARDLEAGLEFLKREMPDVILLDTNLPGSEGFSHFVRVHQAVPAVPVILLSEVDDNRFALEAVRRGAQDFLLKEFLHGKMLARVLVYAIQRKRSEETLRQIAQGVASATGEAFFRSLVQHLAAGLGLTAAFVAEVLEDNPKGVRTLALYSDGKIQDNLEAEIAKTPCQDLSQKQIQRHPNRLRKLFPEDRFILACEAESYLGIPLYDSKGGALGILAVMDKHPMEHTALAESMLEIYAARAAGELDRRRVEAIAARAREREIAIGFRIQQDLLLGRPPADIPNVEVAAHTTPSQEVDGDFYDFFRYSDTCFDVVIGDFMGKGIPAALLGAATKSQFLRALGHLGRKRENLLLPEPAEIVTCVHQQMVHQLIALESFVTICYARFDLEKKQVTLVDCGHTETMHYRRQLGRCDRVRGENMPLGFTAWENYKQVTIPFEPGDSFFFYSDGVTQALNREDELFGEDRLAHLIAQQAKLPAQEVINKVCDSVMDFSNGQGFSDDLTCVMVKIAGAEDDRTPVASSGLELLSSFESLEYGREFLRDFCESKTGGAVSEDRIIHFELATSEALTNVIRHAYEGASDEKIRIELRFYGDELDILIFHHGAPFDARRVRPPSFDGTRDGGFGVYIIEKCVDKVQYISDDNGQQCIYMRTFLKQNKKDEV